MWQIQLIFGTYLVKTLKGWKSDVTIYSGQMAALLREMVEQRNSWDCGNDIADKSQIVIRISPQQEIAQ